MNRRPDHSPAERAAPYASSLVPPLLALAVYLPTLRHALVWDDPLLLARVRTLLGGGGWWRLLTSEFRLTDELSLGYYRPVVLASLALDDAIGGGSPWVFHATNVLLHVIATALLWVLLHDLGFSRLVAGLGTSIFAVHPAHVESVAFVSARTDVLCLVFVLAAVIAWRRAARGTPRARRAWQAAGHAALVMAALSKELALMLPLAFVLLDAGGRRVGPGRDRWGRRGPWLIGCVAAVLLLAALRFLVADVGFGGAGRALEVRAPDAAAWSPSWIPGILATYARILLLPWPLNGYYTADQVGLGPATLAGATGLAAVALVGLRSPLPRAGIAGGLWALLFLLPVTGIVPIAGAVVAERFLYVPSAGFSVMLCAAAAAVGARSASRRALLAAASAATLALGALTLARVPAWQDEETLYAALVAGSPRCVECLENLGITLGARGEHAEALAALRRAVELRPHAARAHNMIGVQLARLGRPADALPHFAEAARLRPDRLFYQENLGRALLDLGRFEDAEAAFRRAIARDPRAPRPRLGLGLSLVGGGRLEEAERERIALEGLDPALARRLAEAIRAAPRGPERPTPRRRRPPLRGEARPPAGSGTSKTSLTR